MGDDWTEVHTLTDAAGKQVTVGHADGYVRIAVRSPADLVLASVVLDGDGRDEFIRAFMEAERQDAARAAERAVISGA
jgi:uncharacterized membrane protein